MFRGTAVIAAHPPVEAASGPETLYVFSMCARTQRRVDGDRGGTYDEGVNKRHIYRTVKRPYSYGRVSNRRSST